MKRKKEEKSKEEEKRKNLFNKLELIIKKNDINENSNLLNTDEIKEINIYKSIKKKPNLKLNNFEIDNLKNNKTNINIDSKIFIYKNKFKIMSNNKL